MAAAHTSVPRWPTEPPDVDATGRTFLVLAYGPNAGPATTRWQSELARLGRPHRLQRFPHAEEDAVHQALAGMVVGTRLMLAGPQHDVLLARGAAQRCGLLRSEIVVAVTDDRDRRVWCAHCGATSLARAAVGETTPCHRCDRSLLVYHHVSRRRGAYLGFMVDAEEVP